MIKNDRQYRVTKAQVRAFEEAIANLLKEPHPPGIDPRLAQTQQKALESQIEEMVSELHEYEGLKNGAIKTFSAQSLEDLPTMLVKARIAREMTHKALAEILHVKEQQVQRWESNDYYGASLETLKAIALALDVTLTQYLSVTRTNEVLAEEGRPYQRTRHVKSFNEIQDALEPLIRMPRNLPKVYIFGDTGAGKTCLVRQLLGTSKQSFPSVRRLRTTVAPTEFIITNEPEFKAAFVFKTEEEVSQYIFEMLEFVVQDAVMAKHGSREDPDLIDLLNESSDQRFRLRCFLDEAVRKKIVRQIHEELAPQVLDWAKFNFPGESDLITVVDLALETKFRPMIREIGIEILRTIVARVRDVCGGIAHTSLPETYSFSNSNRDDFIEALKVFLGLDEGNISPVVEKARIRGNLKSPILPLETEIIITDGEGIGHDAREAKVLSARHFDYFYASDSIILVEDSETPFTRAGKSALGSIATSGYLSKLCIAFSRLDKVDQGTRTAQQREVNRSFRNVISALNQDGISIDKDSLEVRFFSKMNEDQPDSDSQNELITLVEKVIAIHGQTKTRFVAPEYDYELLAAFLANANASFRGLWSGYILGEGAEPAKWQTQKAFTRHIDRREEEFRFLKPVAELREYLMLNLKTFLDNPIKWQEEITDAHKKDCLARMRQEVSNRVLSYIRNKILVAQNPEWHTAAELAGPKTTPIRSRIIVDLIRDSAPALTGEKAIDFKNTIKLILKESIDACKNPSTYARH